MGLFDSKRSKSALAKDRKYFNASEKHEVDYAKSTGRKKKTYFDNGGGVDFTKDDLRNYLGDLDNNKYTEFVEDYVVDSDDANEVENWISNLSQSELDEIGQKINKYANGGGVGSTEHYEELYKKANNNVQGAMELYAGELGIYNMFYGHKVDSAKKAKVKKLQEYLEKKQSLRNKKREYFDPEALVRGIVRKKKYDNGGGVSERDKKINAELGYPNWSGAGVDDWYKSLMIHAEESKTFLNKLKNKKNVDYDDVVELANLIGQDLTDGGNDFIDEDNGEWSDDEAMQVCYAVAEKWLEESGVKVKMKNGGGVGGKDKYIKLYNERIDKAIKDSISKTGEAPEDSWEWIVNEDGDFTADEVAGYYLESYKKKALYAWLENLKNAEVKHDTDERVTEILKEVLGVKYANGGGVDKRDSWHSDHRQYNKSESWEKPMSQRKSRYDVGGGVEEVSIRNPKDLKEFWSNPENANKKIFFVEEMETEDGSDSYYVVGNQTKKYYEDAQYWDYNHNFNDVDDAIEQARKDAKENNAIYMDNRRVTSGYKDGGFLSGLFGKPKRSKSALSKDRKYYNASQEHEVQYAKSTGRNKKPYDSNDGRTYKKGLAYKLDRAKHNKSESWEKPMSQRKKSFDIGGGVDDKNNFGLDKEFNDELYLVKYITKDGDVHEHTLMSSNGGDVDAIFEVLTNFTEVDVLKILSIKRMDNVMNGVYAKGGGVGSSKMKYPKHSYDYGGALTDENVVMQNCSNGEIHCDILEEIIGSKPEYPNQIVGSIKLEKCFLKPYYRICK